MRKRFAGPFVALVLIATGCGPVTPSPPPSAADIPSTPIPAQATPHDELAPAQVLRIALAHDPETLDPTLASLPESIGVVRALQRPLVDLDERLQVVPALAESWTVSDDGRTLTFHLRDARYSNGDPIVAGDLVYSWKRLADPRTAADYAYVLAEVEGAPALLAMAGAHPAPTNAAVEAALARLGAEAPDDRTFVVHLVRPAAYFLSAMTLWVLGPIQRAWIAGPAPTEAANYVSSGPFVLSSWDHDRQIVLKPNPYWWGVKPALTEIRMSMRVEPEQAQLAYEAGELDMVSTPSDDVGRIRSDPTLGGTYQSSARLGIDYYAFNNFADPGRPSNAKPGPTANRDFRIALIQAIDKRAFIDATYGGLGQIANSFIMPGIAGYQPDLDPYPYDLASAKQHMQTALTALGVHSAADLGKLKFGYPTDNGDEPRVAFVAEAWRQAFGLQTKTVGSERTVFIADRQAGAYAISRAGWAADYPHANDQFDGVFNCDPGGNDSHYCDPQFDALVERAAGEQDPEAQVAIYNEAQRLLMDDAAFLPLRFREQPFEVRPYVSGLTVTPTDSFVPGDRFFETIRILRH